jgi:hypothetical protein
VLGVRSPQIAARRGRLQATDTRDPSQPSALVLMSSNGLRTSRSVVRRRARLAADPAVDRLCVATRERPTTLGVAAPTPRGRSAALVFVATFAKRFNANEENDPSSLLRSFGRGGGEETRTPDPLHAKQVLYQLSYTPTGRPGF